MITLNITLLIVLALGIALTLFNYRKVQLERKRNIIISTGIEELMQKTRHEIEKNKKLVERAREQLMGSEEELDSEDPINDPMMLSSILAVIVKKYGALTLNLKDFESTESEDYVSVYVDTKTQDLILSLDHGLVEKKKDPVSLINFSGNDDNTFHQSIYIVKYGDLVKSTRLNSIGVIIEVFEDLDPENPWVRVMFTHPKQGYQWCKMATLQQIDKKEEDRIFGPLLSGAVGGSGSL